MFDTNIKNIAKIDKNDNFIKSNLEKVLRLADILDYLFSDIFKDKLALKGGTAINLAYLNMHRLSVDIDLDYIILDKNEM